MKNIVLFSAVLAALVFTQCKSSKSANGSNKVATLENTRWKLAEMNGTPVIPSDPSKEAYILLTPDKKLQGFAGCNTLAGSYTLDGDKVKFTAITTRMMCGPEQMEVEDFLTNALTQANGYKVTGEGLELLDGETTVAEFVASK